MFDTDLLSTKRNFPSMAWWDMNYIPSMLGCWQHPFLVKLGEMGAAIWGLTRPNATKYDNLHASPFTITSDSSKPILAGAQDIRYPAHCITEYFVSVTEHKQYTIKYICCCCCFCRCHNHHHWCDDDDDNSNDNDDNTQCICHNIWNIT